MCKNILLSTLQLTDLGLPLHGVERAPEYELDLLFHLVGEELHGAEVLAQQLPGKEQYHGLKSVGDSTYFFMLVPF